jgi:hypothetical protein
MFSFEDEAPRYALDEGEPLHAADMAGPQGKSRLGVAVAPVLPEFIGTALVYERQVGGELEIEVHAGPDWVEFGPFRATLPETLNLVAALADACQWICNAPRREQVRQELVTLNNECEQAGVV